MGTSITSFMTDSEFLTSSGGKRAQTRQSDARTVTSLLPYRFTRALITATEIMGKLQWAKHTLPPKSKAGPQGVQTVIDYPAHQIQLHQGKEATSTKHTNPNPES